jgi:hypothetical protein
VGVTGALAHDMFMIGANHTACKANSMPMSPDSSMPPKTSGEKLDEAKAGGSPCTLATSSSTSF